jgi:hypothetical protein
MLTVSAVSPFEPPGNYLRRLLEPYCYVSLPPFAFVLVVDLEIGRFL